MTMTIPFDEVAFRSGAIAIDEYGREVQYLLTKKHVRGFPASIIGSTHYSIYSLYEMKKWSMKPQLADGGTEDWIQHDDDHNPVPWAGIGEFAAIDVDGDLYGDTETASDLCWGQDNDHPGGRIVKFRLTQGWLPVKGDGTIPEAIKGAKAGEWEARLRDGSRNSAPTEIPSVYRWTVNGGAFDIVAVRLIEKKAASPMVFDDTAQHALDEEKLRAWYEETTKRQPLNPVTKSVKEPPAPYRPVDFSRHFLNVLADVVNDVKPVGPIIKCDVIGRLMR
jgi:hypothetical protein